MRPIIDSHLDLAWNAVGWERDITLDLDEINARESQMTGQKARGRATTCLPEMRRGGIVLCLATLLARFKTQDSPSQGNDRKCLDYSNAAMAYAAARGQLAYYQLLEQQGEIRMLRTASDLDQYWQEMGQPPLGRFPIGFILAMEGADPIVSPEQAEAWFRAGLRSVSLAHYGPSRYAVGTGEDGPLTPVGRELLEEFQRLGMMLDVTHLSEPGFSEALDCFGGAVKASHNNCRTLVPGDRQFSDEQIKKLIERDAVIGVVFDAWMLDPDWVQGQAERSAVTIDAALDHIEHICQLSGNCRHVGIGSDLDGGYGTEQTPQGLETIADLQKMASILSDRGYSDGEIDAVFHGNWLRFFREHLPA